MEGVPIERQRDIILDYRRVVGATDYGSQGPALPPMPAQPAPARKQFRSRLSPTRAPARCAFTCRNERAGLCLREEVGYISCWARTRANCSLHLLPNIVKDNGTAAVVDFALAEWLVMPLIQPEPETC